MRDDARDERLMSGLPFHVRGDPPLYTFARGLLVSTARLYGRFEASGTDWLPQAGPAIVVANHPGDIDPIILGIGFPRTLHFMADAVQFRRAFVGRVIPRLAAFPVHRGRPDREALRTALGLLAAGEVVALFPEGDMYTDGVLHPFEPGVGFLALNSGAPIVPAALTGSFGIRDERWLHWPTIRLTVGSPVDVSDIDGNGHAAYEVVAERVEAVVRELRDRAEDAAGRGARRGRAPRPAPAPEEPPEASLGGPEPEGDAAGA
jgi:1-acyl-sn-glycerol-3-phosphate acyltransferase